MLFSTDTLSFNTPYQNHIYIWSIMKYCVSNSDMICSYIHLFIIFTIAIAVRIYVFSLESTALTLQAILVCSLHYFFVKLERMIGDVFALEDFICGESRLGYRYIDFFERG